MISLGNGKEYDLTALHAISKAKIGRAVNIGDKLTNDELAKLGFILAATDAPLRGW
jgi:hypothetical protein